MSVTTPQPISMEVAKTYFGELSLTNYYLVGFNGMGTVDGDSDLMDHLLKYADSTLTEDWISRNVGILCADANLPSSTFATAEVKDNFIGVPQEFAHSRLFTDIDFTFYVDTDYKILRFFEGWMDFISGAGAAQVENGGFNKGYFRRFQYPDSYKINNLSITKFERTLGSIEESFTLDYQFVNAFPKGITSIPVSYGPADLLKITVTFNYDRYVVKNNTVAGLDIVKKSPSPSPVSDLPVIQDIEGQTLPFGTGIPGLNGVLYPNVV
jgi:hypothetical protein